MTHIYYVLRTVVRRRPDSIYCTVLPYKQKSSSCTVLTERDDRRVDDR